MEYEVKDIQHQTYGSAEGTKEVVVFTVEYTTTDFKNTAYLEFEQGTPEGAILAEIGSHGKSLIPKSEMEYTFSKTGVIE